MEPSERKTRAKKADASIVGLILAIASAFLLLGGAMYSGWIGGFRYGDPRLVRIYRGGFLLSAFAFTASCFGYRTPGALRWISPVFSMLMCLAWFVSALGE